MAKREPRFLSTTVQKSIILRMLRLVIDWCSTLLDCDNSESDSLWTFKLKMMLQEGEDFTKFLQRRSRPVFMDVLPTCFEFFNTYIQGFVACYVASAASVSRFHRRLQVVCLLMYDTLLGAFKDDIFDIRSRTMEKLVAQSLNTKCNITCLVLTTWTDHSPQVGSCVKYLRHLETLVFMVNCTDGVIEQVDEHCKGIRKLNVYASKRVTDACSHSLFNMDTLQYINLQFTGTTREEAIKILLGIYGEYRMALFRTFLFP